MLPSCLPRFRLKGRLPSRTAWWSALEPGWQLQPEVQPRHCGAVLESTRGPVPPLSDCDDRVTLPVCVVWVDRWKSQEQSWATWQRCSPTGSSGPVKSSSCSAD